MEGEAMLDCELTKSQGGSFTNVQDHQGYALEG